MEVRRLRSALARREFRLDHRNGHLILIERGRLHLIEADRQLSGGQMTWLPPGERETLRIEAGAGSVGLILPPPELARIVAQGDAGGRLAPLPKTTLTAALPADRQSRMAMLFDDIASEIEASRPDGRLVTEAASTLLLVAFLRLAQPEVARSAWQPPLVDRFVLLAAQHWHEHRSVAGYAEALGVTRFQLGEAVRRHTGRSPQEFLHDMLMERAKGMLSQSTMRVAAIAYRLGYQDPAYFNRAFRRHVGQTPGEWRRARSGAEPPSYAAWP